jgi:hypothetical protein
MRGPHGCGAVGVSVSETWGEGYGTQELRGQVQVQARTELNFSITSCVFVVCRTPLTPNITNVNVNQQAPLSTTTAGSTLQASVTTSASQAFVGTSALADIRKWQFNGYASGKLSLLFSCLSGLLKDKKDKKDKKVSKEQKPGDKKSQKKTKLQSQSSNDVATLTYIQSTSFSLLI